MDKRAIGVIFSLIAIFVLPPAMILIYNLGYYANALSSVVIATATVIYATLTYLLLLEQQKTFYASLFEPTDKNFGSILELIVNNKQELNERHAYRKFWSLYGKEFLSFRERKEITECKAEVDGRRKNSLGLEGSIEKDLMGILKIFRKEYGIPYRWMKEAEDREREEKLGLT